VQQRAGSRFCAHVLIAHRQQPITMPCHPFVFYHDSSFFFDQCPSLFFGFSSRPAIATQQCDFLLAQVCFGRALIEALYLLSIALGAAMLLFASLCLLAECFSEAASPFFSLTAPCAVGCVLLVQ
jgi:hypothetical protein